MTNADWQDLVAAKNVVARLYAEEKAKGIAPSESEGARKKWRLAVTRDTLKMLTEGEWKPLLADVEEKES